MLTQKELKTILHYDELTGTFTWKVTNSNVRPAGTKAGGKCTAISYPKIKINKKLYFAHRLAFLYMTGAMPDYVDHKDHNRQNNIWTNLRPASRTINAKNQSLHKTNTSKYVGVYWHKQNQKWGARIHVNGVSKFLGSFTNKNDAIKARQKANIDYNYHPNHGQ